MPARFLQFPTKHGAMPRRNASYFRPLAVGRWSRTSHRASFAVGLRFCCGTQLVEMENGKEFSGALTIGNTRASFRTLVFPRWRSITDHLSNLVWQKSSLGVPPCCEIRCAPVLDACGASATAQGDGISRQTLERCSIKRYTVVILPIEQCSAFRSWCAGHMYRAKGRPHYDHHQQQDARRSATAISAGRRPADTGRAAGRA